MLGCCSELALRVLAARALAALVAAAPPLFAGPMAVALPLCLARS